MDVGAGLVDTQYEAAQIALLVLRAALQEPAPVEKYLAPNLMGPRPLDEAVRALAAFTKPVHCEAHLNGSMLIVECRRIIDPPALERRRTRAARFASFWEDAARARCRETADDVAVLLKGRGDDTLRVRLSSLEAWSRDYEMRYTLGLDESASPSAGVCMTIEVSEPQRAEIHYEMHDEED